MSLRRAGNDAVLSNHSDLVVYECDGFVIEKNCPDVVVFPRTTAATWPQIVKLCNRARSARSAARGGHEPGRRLLAGRRRRDDRAHADEARSWRSTSATATPSSSRAWSMSGSTNALQGHRLSLRSRSVEPGGLHDRRQRGDELRRAAHAEVRRDGQPRARRRGRAGRRPRSCSSAARRRTTPGLDLVGAIVGSEGTLAIVTKVWVRLTRNPQG